ncbi:MAG: tRNA (adenosine(37)-N6)-threonylcarbamoyltransferase complex ATPase subunit type 1 TsaE [Bacteroidia bacterium]|nr:tRNA (adenosine(37)-N6)-threonylcarbamoyltransferase complex ATPase subunit type 1 TsaE [Bacteroidia bacterium]
MTEWAVWDCVQELDWQKIAIDVFKNFAGYRPIWLLSGDLGAGKTSFAKALGHWIIPEATIQSPTFSLIQEYQNNQIHFYHADLYRLNKVEDIYELGLIELMDSGKLLLIEWPEIILPIVPASAAIWLKFSYTGDPTTRLCTLYLPNEANFGQNHLNL